jgi:hypothetical protein
MLLECSFHTDAVAAGLQSAADDVFQSNSRTMIFEAMLIVSTLCYVLAIIIFGDCTHRTSKGGCQVM